MKNLFILLCLSFASFTFACGEHGGGIVEENNLWISTDAKFQSGIDEVEFNKVIESIEKLYAPIVAERGATLKVVRNWTDGTVNAYAQQTGKTWMVSMFGGLARHQAITSDGFAMVVCHEIGHHLGGAPRKVGLGMSSWASNEGQADYWGAMKCMKRYYDSMEPSEFESRLAKVDAVATKKCAEVYTDETDQKFCQMTAMAGLSLGNLFKALRRTTTELRFDTPDRAVVTRTNDNHPDSQCRVDTYFQGGLCERGFDEEVSNTDAKVGTCNTSEGYEIGVRPLCWFKP